MKIRNTNYLLTYDLTFLALLLLSFGLARAQSSETPPGTTEQSELLNTRAVELAEAGDYPKAIELFREAIRLRPEYAVAYGNLGNAFYRTGQPENAVAALQKAIQIDPSFAEAYVCLGVVLTDSGKHAEAVEALKQAVRLNPDLARAYYNLGCVYIRQKKFSEAAAALERSAVLEADNAETHVQWGYALSRLKKYAEAIRQIETAVRLNPNDAQVRFFLGNLYLLNRDKQSALAHYRKLEQQNAELAKQLYVAIYSNLLVNIGEK